MYKQPTFEPQGFRFDKTITAGNLLTLLAGMIALGGAFVDYRITLDRHETRIALTETRVTELYQRSSSEAVTRADQTRALDKLTSTLEARDKYTHPSPP